MNKIEPLCNLVQVIGIVLLIIGLVFLSDKGFAFLIVGLTLIIIGFILKVITNNFTEEFRDLKTEVHELRKKVESLKK